MDQGARYVVQGNGSGPALAIMDALEKHNARNPGKEVLFLNYAAVDPDLTNSKCSYWHFRLDADTSMKMEALTTYMKDPPEVKKVLPDQPELFARPAGVQVRQRDDGPQAPLMCSSWVTTCTHWHRCATLPLHRQDQGFWRRQRDHRQLGL